MIHGTSIVCKEDVIDAELPGDFEKCRVRIASRLAYSIVHRVVGGYNSRVNQHLARMLVQVPEDDSPVFVVGIVWGYSSSLIPVNLVLVPRCIDETRIWNCDTFKVCPWSEFWSVTSLSAVFVSITVPGSAQPRRVVSTS